MNITLSVWSRYYKELSFEDAIRAFIKQGVYAVELSCEHGLELFSRSEDVVATGRAVQAFLKENNFTMTQGHLPLHFAIVGQREEMATMLRLIDLYEACGVQNMVLHCDRMYKKPDLLAKERFDENIISLKIIAEHIREKNICICLENLRQPRIYPVKEALPLGFAEDLIHLIDAVGSEKFGICLDTGHLNLVGGNQGDFIRTAGSYLRALHIADNQNVNDVDEHLMPFGRGTVDFIDVVRALREINYSGMFNFEIPGENRCPLPIRNAKLQYIKTIYAYLLAETEQ